MTLRRLRHSVEPDACREREEQVREERRRAEEAHLARPRVEDEHGDERAPRAARSGRRAATPRTRARSSGNRAPGGASSDDGLGPDRPVRRPVRPPPARRRPSRGRSAPRPPRAARGPSGPAPPRSRRGGAPADRRAPRAAAARARRQRPRPGSGRRPCGEASGSGRRARRRSRARTSRSRRAGRARRAAARSGRSGARGSWSAHRHLHGDAPAVEAVGALAVDLHRGGRRARAARRRPRARGCRLLAGDRRLLHDLALPVAGRRAQAEADLGPVALVQADEVAREPGPAAEQDEQEAGRERVERPGVPGLHPVASAQVGHDGERRRPGRLVDQDEPGCRLPAARQSTNRACVSPSQGPPRPRKRLAPPAPAGGRAFACARETQAGSPLAATARSRRG